MTIKQFNIGDKVSVLDDDFEGKVIQINKSQITIETTDGFTLNYAPSELILLTKTTEMNNMNFNSAAILHQKEIPKPRSFIKEKKAKNEVGVPEFDLHIEKLVPNKRGMSNYDILTLQTETAKRHIDFAIKNRIPKIVFIHGVGEGVLKAELDFMLGRYEQITFHDADYRKYGLGATEVILKQRKLQ